jgi:hypothetical protein
MHDRKPEVPCAWRRVRPSTPFYECYPEITYRDGAHPAFPELARRMAELREVRAAWRVRTMTARNTGDDSGECAPPPVAFSLIVPRARSVDSV